VARPRGVKHAVRYRHRAIATSGADQVQVSAHVHSAAEVSEAGADAATETHPSVTGSLDDKDLIVRRTSKVQRLHCAVLDRNRRQRSLTTCAQKLEHYINRGRR